MIYLSIENKKYLKKIKYVFDTIFFNLGLEYKVLSQEKPANINKKDILIIYNFTEEYEKKIIDKCLFKNVIIIRESMKLFHDDFYMKECSLQDIKIKNFTAFSEYSLISIFSGCEELFIHRIHKEKRRMFLTNFDMVSDIFFMLTRYEEIVNKQIIDNEAHKRFTGRESLAYKNNFLDRPIVNEDIEFIWCMINTLNPQLKKKKWWGEKDFAVCLTHDVDLLFKYSGILKEIRNSARFLLKERSFGKFLKNIKMFFKSKHDYTKDPYWNLEYLMAIENSRGFKSSFYFMSGGNSDYDNNYDVEDNRIINLIHQIENNGFEAGYHGSYNSYSDINIMNNEKTKLDKIIKNEKFGCRQHYLRFETPLTWKLQEQVGIKYDATLGYADCEGFRTGYCFPYKPYSILEDRVLDIWEIPLIVMEATIVSPNYSNLNRKTGMYKIEKLICTVEKYKGVFNILWHNSSFDDMDNTWLNWNGAYEEILDFILRKKAYVNSGYEIISSKMEL